MKIAGFSDFLHNFCLLLYTQNDQFFEGILTLRRHRKCIHELVLILVSMERGCNSPLGELGLI